MKVYIGADHRGFEFKAKIIDLLEKLGHKVIDLGTYNSIDSCDYPDIAEEVVTSALASPDSRAILVCMSGIGQSIVANKIPGALAALCYNAEAAQLSRQHNNSNVLVLSSKFTNQNELSKILELWMVTEFEGGRHAVRVEKIQQVEKKFSASNNRRSGGRRHSSGQKSGGNRGQSSSNNNRRRRTEASPAKTENGSAKPEVKSEPKKEQPTASVKKENTQTQTKPQTPSKPSPRKSSGRGSGSSSRRRPPQKKPTAE